MKHAFRDKLLLLMVAAFLLFPLQGADAAPGSLLHSSNLNISREAQISSGVYWSSALNDRVTENYIEYIPNSTVVPIIAYGDYIYGGNSLARLDSIMAGRGNRVVAAINADYFNMSTVVPLSTVIEDGVLKGNEGSSWASVGFYEDGRAMIGRLGLVMQMDTDSQSYVIGKLNKELTAGGQSIQLFTADYATTTRSNVASYAAILRISNGYVGVNRTVTAYVESASAVNGPVEIPPGCLVLALAQDSENEIAKAAVAGMRPGQQVSISFRGNAAWEDVRYAVGAGEKLLTNGEVVAPEFSVGMTTPLSPRTALGVRADGSFILYSVDGRQAGYSAGATLADVALRLKELGCVEAVNFDGGGSTTLSAVYPGQEGLKTVNSPSGGTLRTCANYILLVNRGYDGGSARQLHLYPFDSLVLAGASLDFSLAATNESYLPAALPYAGVNYQVSDQNIGYVDENGRFTAGSSPGSGYVQAEAGGVSGSARITVVDRVDSVNMTYKASGQTVGSEVTLYGGGSLELSMQATYNHMNIIADAGSFNWNLTGDIGTIDQNGLLTAHRHISEGSGTLTASLGSMSISVPVRISSKGELLEDFESFSGYDGWGWSLAQHTDKAYVRFGNAAGRLDYFFDPAAGNTLNIPLSMQLADGPSYVSFWVYGDESNNQLLLTLLRDGELVELPAVTLDFNGWQNVSLPLPQGVTAMNGFTLINYGQSAGTLYLDQIMSSHGLYVDNEPPQISISVADGALSATVSDAMDKDLPAASIRLAYDGVVLNFDYDPAAKKLTTVLPQSDGRAHRISVTARDKSGNIGSASFDLAATEEQQQPFVDMKGHWAESYTTYLYQQGIVNGMQTSRGFGYAPDTNMNRAQFAVIICNWLKIDTAQYTYVDLPFDDKASIGEWAYPSIQAMYALGVTKGSALNGKLNFNPGSPISRAEAMTMIGRTQERGYTEVALNFADSASVPEWAAPYVRTLVAQQVVGGVGENKLAPNAYVTRAQVAKMLYSLI